MFDGPTQIVPDTREDYGEDRSPAIGNLNGIVVVAVFVETTTATRFRVISFRKANVQERKEYEEFVKDRLGSDPSDEGF